MLPQVLVLLVTASLTPSCLAQGESKPDPVALLIADLGNPKRASRAAFGLVVMGKRAVPALLTALKDRKTRVRALAVLGRMGPSAASAIAPLFETARKLPPEEVPAILRTVADLAPVCGLSSRDLWEPLGIVVTEAQSAAEIEGLAELRRRIRWEWKRTIERTVLTRDTPTKELIEALGHDLGFRREGAAYLLGWRGRKAIEAVPTLLEGLNSKHPKVVYWPVTTKLGEQVDYTDEIHDTIAEALVRIAPTSRSAVPAHARRLRSSDEETRRRSAMALRVQGERAKGAVPDLVKALDDPSLLVVREVVTTLGIIGRSAKDAVPRMQKLTRHKDRQIRERAKAALRQIEGK